jgi:hypothetical protein
VTAVADCSTEPVDAIAADLEYFRRVFHLAMAADPTQNTEWVTQATRERLGALLAHTPDLHCEKCGKRHSAVYVTLWGTRCDRDGGRIK